MKTKSKKDFIDEQRLNISSEYIIFRDIEEAELNAQKMSDDAFRRLMYNIKRDGVLTSSPLIMRQKEKNKYRCISGHHRIKAAIKLGIEGCICLVIDEVDESTRIRLQIAHNDINGTPDQDIVSVLLKKLNSIDINLVDDFNIEDFEKKINDANVDVPNFQYINICLCEQSRSDLVDMILELEKSDAVNWLITQEQYIKTKDLLTFAFEKGFKTPGQAFGKFLDIIKENEHLIKR